MKYKPQESTRKHVDNTGSDILQITHVLGCTSGPSDSIEFSMCLVDK